MEIHIAFFKLVVHLLSQLLVASYCKAARKVKSFSFHGKPSVKPSSLTNPSYPSVSKCSLACRKDQTVVCDINGGLLRTPSFFPYLMLTAFEGGSILRAFFLLIVYPFLFLLSDGRRMKAMVFISFCGLTVKDGKTVARAVLPKFFLEELHFQAYQVLDSCKKRKVVVTSVPRILVEYFLKEYLSVDVVVGAEMQMKGNYFTGFLTDDSSSDFAKHKALKDIFGDAKPDIGIGRNNLEDQYFMSLCKEAYVMNKQEEKSGLSSIMPKEKYPKPLVFHDGRLAFLPTPLNSFIMFAWIPLGVPLSIVRLAAGCLLPRKFFVAAGAITGVILKIQGADRAIINKEEGVLYVCSHRTLLDPVMLSGAIARPVTAVTYSLSIVSEIISPIKTARLVRDRDRDAETMDHLLKEGDLVVCPEGTTCREPYLLRFSPLFAELAQNIVPVAINASVSMFYGTTASGFKCLDPFFFLMNPLPVYEIEFLRRVPKEFTCFGGKESMEVANYVQRELADALGFECTNLTRKDKYMMLAGNEGIVSQKK